MKCPKCHYEPTLAEVQRSPGDCVKCGINYEGHARHVAEAAEKRKAEEELNASIAKSPQAVRNARLQYPGAQPVVVVDISMSFWSMVVFMVKWAFATIPAILIICILVYGGFAIVGLAGTMFWKGTQKVSESPRIELSKQALATPDSDNGYVDDGDGSSHRIKVPLPVKERYYELGRDSENGIALITVKTEWDDGRVYYSKLAVNCQAAVAGFIASGSTPGELQNARIEQFEEIKDNTPRKYIAVRACRGHDSVNALLR